MAFELKFQRTALSLDFLREAGDLERVPSMNGSRGGNTPLPMERGQSGRDSLCLT